LKAWGKQLLQGAPMTVAKVLQLLQGDPQHVAWDRMTDAQLLQGFVATRADAAFAALVRRHSGMVWGVCLRVLRQHQDAEDAFQATLLVLLRKATSIRPPHMVGNWLYGVAHYTALKARAMNAKRRSQQRQSAATLANAKANQEADQELQQLLDQELSRLPDKYRAIVVMCDLEGKTRAEAARQLGLPEGTVAGRLTRARAMLARRLARQGLAVSATALVGELAQSCASAAPAIVVASALQTACHAKASGAVPSKIAALTERVVKTMFLNQLLRGTVPVVLTAVALLGAAVVLQTTLGPSSTEASAQPVAEKGIKAEPSQKGDPSRKPGQADKDPVALQDLQQRFGQLSPEARLELIDKIATDEKEFQPVSSGDVTLTVVARGSLESADSGDIYCKVRTAVAGKPGTMTIKGIIDNGSDVRKGDVLIQLDDSGLRDELKAKTKDYQRALVEMKTFEATRDVQKLQNQLDVIAGEIALRGAELDVKKYAGNDNEEKEILQLKADKARLSLQLAKAAGKIRLTQADADLEAKTANANAELALINSIKDQFELCIIKASKDGMVVYYVPPRWEDRFQVVAQGEPVREGQKLLQMPDLNNILVNSRIPEALVTFLHSEGKDKSQAALIKVDAFPNTVLKGHVKLVDNVASHQSFLAGEKVYRTLIAIDNEKNPQKPSLRPGMSAEVTIEDVARKTGVVRVPVQAVVHAGQGHYCYVKVGKEIQKREVTPGLTGNEFVEIKSGVKDGEAVLRDVDAVLRRLSPLLGPQPPEKKR
jgi:RNA polymerase sigma factor (sigma-70 family)